MRKKWAPRGVGNSVMEGGASEKEIQSAEVVGRIIVIADHRSHKVKFLILQSSWTDALSNREDLIKFVCRVA